jgi:hypothetical protein
MAEENTVGAKVDAVVAKIRGTNWLKKSVTVPVKVLVIAGGVVLLLAVALSLSRRVEPEMSRLLWNDSPAKALDVATAEAAVRGLKEHITATCKPVVKVEAKKAGK